MRRAAHKILLIDNEQMMLDMLRNQLAMERCFVITAKAALLLLLVLSGCARERVLVSHAQQLEQLRYENGEIFP